jgi:phosphopantothenoylcysteine decarboxylase/phosphopantothenate--cysteine ligase
MTAAVADWRPAQVSPVKIKKGGGFLDLRLEPTEDVLRSVAGLKGERFFVGFAAETGNPLVEAARKMREKGLDLIVANDVTRSGAGFESDTNLVTILAPDGSRIELPLMSKADVATHLLERIEVEIRLRRTGPARG